jgi:DNA polymerase-1
VTIFLVDGHAIAYRSYYAFIRNPLTNSRGENTSAVYGFIRVILRLMEKYAPDRLVVVFDSEEETGRHQQYEQYKANRTAMPDDMRPQIPIIKEVLEAMGLPVLAAPGYEADDIIATIALKAADEGFDVRIVSSDKDLFQLLGDHVRMIRPSKGNDLEDEIGPEYLRERFGLSPAQIVDLLAMMGDSSDNITGIKGIGEKTALKLLQEYGTLDRVIENAESIKPAHVGRKIVEGKEDALFSRELVKLASVPMEFSYDSLVRRGQDETKLTGILLEMEFHQIIKELGLGSRIRENSGYMPVGGDGLKDLAAALREAGDFVLDVETTSLDPLEAELVGISFCVSEGRAWYVPVAAAADDGSGLFAAEAAPVKWADLDSLRKTLGPVLADPDICKAGHNIKYDLKVLESHGFTVENGTWDTMLASYVIDPSRRSHSLDNLAMEFLKHRMIPYDELFEKGDRTRDIRTVSVERLCEYSCEDADFTLRLKKIFSERLAEEGLAGLFDHVERPLLLVLKSMEMAGMGLDAGRLKELSTTISEEMERLTARIYAAAGEEFNINSNRQLQTIMFEKLGLPSGRKTKTGFSTDVDVLTELAAQHPLAGLVLEYRQLAKMASTYVDNLPLLINGKTGRIHTSFNQSVTTTGRLSSSEPNLQNIPIRTELGRQIRSAFIPAEGNVLLDADYSQVELRIMAHLSRDPELVRAFNEDADIHTRTASRIYGVEEKDVSKEMRSAAKTINFGVIYGQGPRALSQQLRIPFEEAKRFIDEYFGKYPGIGEFIETAKEFARKNGYSETLLGRRRPLPDINSANGGFRSFSERIAVNTPIQGTAADLIKVAMIEIHAEMARLGLESRMILQVHDELVFDAVPGEVERLKDLVKTRMESAIMLAVPLKVEIGTGKNWMEAH